MDEIKKADWWPENRKIRETDSETNIVLSVSDYKTIINKVIDECRIAAMKDRERLLERCSVENINKMLEPFEDQVKWGGSEDSEGNLSQGNIDFDELAKAIHQLIKGESA